jgi:hypothetical protein
MAVTQYCDVNCLTNGSNTVLWCQLFNKLNILPLHSQYILSLLLFVVKNIEEFISNSKVHSNNTRHRSDLYPQSTKLTKYQKAGYYTGSKVFSHLPKNMKSPSWNVNNLNYL